MDGLRVVMKCWWDGTDGGKRYNTDRQTDRHLSHCLLVHHKTSMVGPESESGPVSRQQQTAYLLTIYLLTFLLTYLLTYYLLTYFLTYFPTYLLTFLLTYLLTCLLFTNFLTYLLTFLLTYLLAYLLTYLL